MMHSWKYYKEILSEKNKEEIRIEDTSAYKGIDVIDITTITHVDISRQYKNIRW